MIVLSNLPKATTQNAETEWSLAEGGCLQESNRRTGIWTENSETDGNVKVYEPGILSVRRLDLV